jgi:Fe-S-cluster-containing hydrogenase component 2
MKKAVIDKSLCDKSPFCPVKRVCPVGAVTQDGKLFSSDFPTVDPEKCIGCGECVKVCPRRAVKMK